MAGSDRINSLLNGGDMENSIAQPNVNHIPRGRREEGRGGRETVLYKKKAIVNKEKKLQLH